MGLFCSLLSFERLSRLAPSSPIKHSQICGSIMKYTQEDVMPFETCLHALIFLSETAGLLVQEEWGGQQ